jgi:hypothetical protein
MGIGPTRYGTSFGRTSHPDSALRNPLQNKKLIDEVNAAPYSCTAVFSSASRKGPIFLAAMGFFLA